MRLIQIARIPFMLFPALASVLVSPAGHATTFATMQSSIFNSNSVQACISCHHSSLVGAARHAAPVTADFDLYSESASRADLINTYISMDLMPNDPAQPDYTFKAPLSAGEKIIVADWANDGAPLAAATAVTNSTVTSISKTGGTLSGTFNTNVHAATTVPGTWYFQYGLTAGYGSNTTITNRSSITGATLTAPITGLSCGTTYHFRARATNGNNTDSGVDQTFNTSACTNPVITEGASISPAASNEDTQTTFSLNRTDDDPGTLTWSVFAQGSKGTFSFDTSTTASPVTVRYTPTANQNGADTSGRIRVTNSTTGLSDTITVNMSITAINDQPAITSTAPATATEDTLYTYPVIVNDPDDAFGAGLSIALSNQPAGMTVNTGTGVISWTPGNGVTTSGTVTVTVTDGGENGTVAAVQMFSVAVSATNDPPSITSTAPTTATEDVQYVYQVAVTDVDDANNGVDLTFSLINPPTGMVVSSTGRITWTPLEGVTSSGAVTVRVADGGENGATPATENFTVTVTQVNDPPIITSSVAVTSFIEKAAFSYQVVVNDPDDAFGAGLAIALSNQPSGMTVNATGLVSWAIPRTAVFNNSYSNITVTVSDGGEDGAAAAVQPFTLTVNPADADADGVPNYSDNCPSVANPGQEDMDNDTVRILPQTDPSGIPANGDVDPSARDAMNALSESYLRGGDACDEDVDGDGISKAYEDSVAYLSDTNAADAALDQDNDGLSNLDEFLAGTDPGVDSVAPVVIAPANITVNATGYLTKVNTGVATASDGNDGSISRVVAVVDKTLVSCAELSAYSATPPAFRPGAHVVNWTTCDKAGNLASAVQSVRVNPILSTTAGQSIGEGQTAIVKFLLNGPAASYPVSVNYQVSGTADSADHNLASGILNIVSGLSGQLSIDIAADALTEDDETMTIRLSNPSNAVLGVINAHNIIITANDTAPILTTAVTQNGISTGHTVYGDAGNAITVDIISTDTQPASTPVFDWSMTANALSPVVANITSTATTSRLAIDLSGVAPGLYPVVVNVTDNGLATTTSFLLKVVATSPVLAAVDSDGDGVNDDDASEGVIDSNANGIPNYLDDSRIVSANVLQNQTGDPANSYLLATDAGLALRLGTTALAADAGGVLISQQNIDEHGGPSGGAGIDTLDSYTNLGGYFDYEITGLNTAISTARVVIPLSTAIIGDVEYRKYNGTAWSTFVVDANNTVSSARGALGVCPAPGSPEYTPGLTAFNYCIQLKIEDGGPNDADGVRDYVIRDPGGVGIAPEVAVKQESGKGRIGVLHPALLLFMFVAIAIQVQRRARTA